MNLFEENFLNETEKFNKHSLNKKDDVQQLISAAVKLKKEDEFKELIFTAKYLKGLLRILNKAPSIPEVQSVEYIQADITENMKKIMDQLRSLLSGTESGVKDFFEKNYFSPNKNSLSNLNLLLADLESVKKYLNYLKYHQ